MSKKVVLYSTSATGMLQTKKHIQSLKLILDNKKVKYEVRGLLCAITHAKVTHLLLSCSFCRKLIAPLSPRSNNTWLPFQANVCCLKCLWMTNTLAYVLCSIAVAVIKTLCLCRVGKKSKD